MKRHPTRHPRAGDAATGPVPPRPGIAAKTGWPANPHNPLPRLPPMHPVTWGRPYVEVYTTHERVICPDHGLWIGGGVGTTADQFSIGACQEIIEAWHHYKNLIARHGPVQVRRAFHISSIINWSWYDQYQHFSAAIDTYEALTTDHPRQANSPALIAAALYPSIVALTAPMASPRWCYIARSPHPDAFHDRVSNEITEGWTLQGAFDPHRHWMETNWPAEFRGSDTILPPKHR